MRFSHHKDEYALLARHYDAIVGPFLKPVRREICRIALSRRFHNILDICCGTGEQCEMLARVGLSVSGVDLSPAMLAVARTSGSGKVCYYEEDASNLHFADNSFDAALISLALHEKSSDLRMKILEEACRVLKADGVLLIVDYAAPDSWSAKAALGCLGVAEWFAGVEHYARFKSYMASGAMDTLLAGQKLTTVHRKRFHLGATALIVAQKKT